MVYLQVIVHEVALGVAACADLVLAWIGAASDVDVAGVVNTFTSLAIGFLDFLGFWTFEG